MKDYIMHYGVKGQRWGVRRYQNYDGTRIKGGKTVFVSGSSKTQSKDSGYYRKKLPKQIRHELKSHMRKGNKIIVGDAPGIDRQIQDYLNKKRYSNVEIYGPGTKVRYSANKNWKTNPINDKRTKEGSKAWLAAKDKAMTKVADEGLAVTLDEGAKATRKNVDRLLDSGKDVKTFELSKDGKRKDDWDRITKIGKTNKDVNDIADSMSLLDKQFLMGGNVTDKDKYINDKRNGQYIIKRVLKKVGKTPVSFFDIYDDNNDHLSVAIGTRNDNKYRNKGYGYKVAKQGLKWYEKNKSKFGNKPLIWDAHETNKKSINLAKKLDFDYVRGSRNNDGWVQYKKH